MVSLKISVKKTTILILVLTILVFFYFWTGQEMPRLPQYCEETIRSLIPVYWVLLIGGLAYTIHRAGLKSVVRALPVSPLWILYITFFACPIYEAVVAPIVIRNSFVPAYPSSILWILAPFIFFLPLVCFFFYWWNSGRKLPASVFMTLILAMAAAFNDYTSDLQVNVYLGHIILVPLFIGWTPMKLIQLAKSERKKLWIALALPVILLLGNLYTGALSKLLA